MDGVADGHRYLKPNQVQKCACGVERPKRGHFFWSCEVAMAVVNELHRGFCPTQPPLVKSNVWLMHAPAGMHDQFWMVLCLCALNGIDVGRRKLLSLRLQGRSTDVDDPDYNAPVRRNRNHVTVHVHSNLDRVKLAKGTAISEFLGRVADWKALSRIPD